ncbi:MULTISPECIES: hypothetical protein [Bacillus]|uniref:hypothetical protein n=1 Tax=Bacillus TaxID=1386 RepID=UPI001582E577|nr:hypothetical protein [Bacillus glycinifermentans]MBU8786803.1 hypothetical protein [Bacillus glycinifermentans]NUJ16137.1 hypothetical protein [Bacillus glycinifermentans]
MRYLLLQNLVAFLLPYFILIFLGILFKKSVIEKNELIIKHYILKNTRESSQEGLLKFFSKFHIIDVLSIRRMKTIKSWLINKHSIDDLKMIKIATEDEFKRKENFLSRVTFVNLFFLPFFTGVVSFVVPLFTFIFSLTAFGIQQEYIKASESNPTMSFFAFFDLTNPDNNQLERYIRPIFNMVYYDTVGFFFQAFSFIVLVVGVSLFLRRLSLRNTSRLHLITQQAYEEKLKKVEKLTSDIREVKKKLALNWNMCTLNDSKENLEIMFISPDKADCFLLESNEEKDIVELRTIIKDIDSKFNES